VFIDGRFVAAADGRVFEDVSPRDGRVLADVARGSADDVDRAVRAARRSFDDGVWALADPLERKRVLLRLAGLIDEHAEELAQLESADVGHPISDARGVDAPGARNFYNAGQTCHAGSRVVVARNLVEPLSERLVEFARGMVPADPAEPETQLGAMVSVDHLAGVLARVERGVGDGARLLVGGERVEPVPGGAYMEPTVLEALDPSSAIVPEEVFGPVVAIQSGHGRDRSLHARESYTHLKTTWLGL
jgi:acyl-CoA reductase-like NAD-dependent aldehyde dehydrogenase